MKKPTMLLAVLLAASLAYAEGGKDKKDKDTTHEAVSDVKDAAKGVKNEIKDVVTDKTHEVEAEVVSVDSAKSTITLKTEKGESTAPVEGKAQASLKDVKPGQKITAVCRDDEKGAHKAVTEIKLKTSATEKK
jgi:uncharacterized protein (UPF0333 family)